ncbi:MAG: ice-binding family protein [Myxococcales bacterium]
MNKLSMALPLSTFLPLALMFAACSGDDASDASDGSSAGSGATSTAGGVTSSAGERASGADAGAGAATPGGAGSSTEPSAQAGDANSGGRDGSELGPAAVPLGTAEGYAILAKSAISNVPTSKVTGDLGLSPAAASYVTGFSLTKAGTSWTSSQVVGNVFAANNDPPTPTVLTTAIADMQSAYTDAAGRSKPDFVNLGAGAIGGLSLEPGLYKWTSTVTIPTDVTLAGSADAVWIFQVSGDLQLAAAKEMVMSGGAQAAHVFWQVAGAVDFGANSHAEGVVLSKTAIKLETGASINGRLLAQTAVSLAGATVNEP